MGPRLRRRDLRPDQRITPGQVAKIIGRATPDGMTRAEAVVSQGVVPPFSWLSVSGGAWARAVHSPRPRPC